MSEPKIGRVLAASLHQSISELIPTRVEFYETWLTAVRIRRGDLGRARFAAVVSFLRREGAAYDAIVGRAGGYAADLLVDALPVVERALLRRVPTPIRVRVVLRLAARMIRGLHDDGRLRVRVRRGTAVVTVRGSVFCDVREPASAPLCRFYGAVLVRSLEAFGMSSRFQLSRCRATGDGACELIIHIGEPETRPSDAAFPCVPPAAAIPWDQDMRR